MTDEKTPEPQKIPPKLTVRPADSTADSGAKEQQSAPANDAPPSPSTPPAVETNTDDKAPPQPQTGDEPTLILKKSEQDAEDNKKKTSRISLDSALSMRIDDVMGEVSGGDSKKDGGPKTIRLSRPPSAGAESKPAAEAVADKGGPKTIRLKRPSDAAAPSTSSQAAKKKTSRISLDNVLQSNAKAGESSTAAGGATDIKTIRLKRPDAGKSQSSAAKIPGGESAADKDAGEQDAKSRTSRLDTSDTEEPAADAVPTTQRKTIRIKRPDGSGVSKPSRTLSLARDKTGAPAEAEAPEESASSEEPLPAQRPGLVFTLATVAAVIVAALLVYMLAAQAFPDAGLSWWGQINP